MLTIEQIQALSDEDLNWELALAAGGKFYELDHGYGFGGPDGGYTLEGFIRDSESDKRRALDYLKGCAPCYASDLNACHELEEKLEHEQSVEYMRVLLESLECSGGGYFCWLGNAWEIIHIPARQRAEALLYALQGDK